jgi:alginate O-acetyltransferase complex protein AlgI
VEIVSWNFLFFSTIVIAVYYCLNWKVQNVWLLGASIFFICSWGWTNLVPLFFISVITYFIGGKLRNKQKELWLIFGITLIVTTFVLLRVVNSPLFNFANLINGSPTSSIFRQIFIPLGFSFYFLQVLSYLIDVYKSKLDAEPNFIDYLLYLLYFPKFLAGPIERPGNFLPQLKSQRTVDNRKLSLGFTLIFIGIFRKIFIAQVLLSILPLDYIHAAVINTHPESGFFSIPFYSYATTIPYFNRLIGIIAFGIYIYNDFAGYTGIVRGISLLLGINLAPNFRTPFFAASLSEFWSRWHISLSSWLRDYIYYPITRILRKKTGIQFSAPAILLPFLITMFLSGIWHGLTIPILIWGFLYGLIMGLEQITFQKWPGLRPQNLSRFSKIFAGLITFIIVTLTWVPFTASSFQEILAFVKVLFKGSGLASKPDFSPWIPILIAVSFILDFLQTRNKDETFLLNWPLPLRAAFVTTIFLLLILGFTWTSPYTSKVFIYQGF